MKRLKFFHWAGACVLGALLSSEVPGANNTAETSVATLVEQLLDSSKSNNERDAIIEANAGRAGEIVRGLVSDLAVGTPEEYKRIPLIWRVSIAAGKRNEAGELKSLLDVSLPKMDESLRHWQAVVIGGGIINGISLAGPWPGDRLASLQLSKDLKARLKRSIDLASTMADDEKVPHGTRYDALRMLGIDTWERRGAQLSRYLGKGVNGELQQGAVSGLADVKSKNVGPAFVQNFDHFTPGNRKFALDALFRDESRLGAVLDLIELGKVEASSLGSERTTQLLAVSNKKLRARAEKLFRPHKESADHQHDGEGRTYSAGVARIDITPDYPIRLHGYGGRRKESEGVIQRIYAKALAIGSDQEGPAMLISVDNCMVPEQIRDELLKRLMKVGVTSHKFAICSSHTHSAPKLAHAADNIFGADIIPAEQERIDRYTRELTDKMEQVALAALKDRKPAKLLWGKGKAEFALNRRTKGGPVDHDLPVLQLQGLDGKIRGLLVNYACHCTTLSDTPNQICGDWAGYAQEYLERDHPGAIALTVIGCGADANPHPRTGVEFAQQNGESINKGVKAVLSGELTPLAGSLQCRTKRIILPFDKLPSMQHWTDMAKRDDAIGYHAKKNLKRLEKGEALQTELPYLVQVWNFGKDMAMVFLPGEVVVDYALRLKKEFDPERMWVNAYANDVPCYIPSKRILDEGGYEGGGAMIYYDRPTRLGANTEELIIGAVRELMPPGYQYDEKKMESPDALTPEQALKSIRTKPGFVVDLVASEPLIVDPVAIDFGTDGRLWVCEMHDYPSGMKGNHEPGGRIKILEDTDRDGKYDTSTLFLDGLPYPTGVMQWRKGALICAAPDILYAEDVNGDGKAEYVKKLFTGFATHNYQARVNSLRWGLDNWVYGACGLFGGKIKSELTGKEFELTGRDFRINPDTGEFEPASGVTQQSRVRDDWGNWFGNDNSTFLWIYPLPDHYVRRNPNVAPPESRIYGAKDPDPNLLYPISRTLERFNNPNSANRTTSACGLEIYRDVLLGKEYLGNAFTGETVHNLVHRLVLWPDGVTFSGYCANDEKNSEFLASTDNWFRPVEMRTGRDGALWVVDMYRFVIEHPRWIPEDRLAKLDVRAGDDKGRIYRVYPSSAKLRPVRDLTRVLTVDLVALLDTPNGPERDLVHRELYQRHDKGAVPALVELARTSSEPIVRAQALCVLEGLGELQPEHVAVALEDSIPEVRRNAVRLSEEIFASKRGPDRRVDMWSSPGIGFMRDSLFGLVDDPDLGVRFQLALSLGEISDSRAGKALGELARKNIGHPWMRAAVLSSATRFPTEILKKVLEVPAETPVRTEMIGQLIATATSTNNEANLEAIIIAIAPKPKQDLAEWQLTAIASLQEALDRNKMSLDKFVRFRTSAVNEAAQRIEAIVKSAGKMAVDKSAPIQEREIAVRLLASSPSDEDVQTLIGFVADSNARLQKAAMSALRRQKHPKLPELLLAGWKNYMVSARPALIDLLLNREEGIKSLLDALEKGVIVVAEISAAGRQQLLTHTNKEIQARAQSLFPQNDSRKSVLALFNADVPKLTGRADRGAEVFAQMCANCHAFRGQGTSVGPDLMPIANKPTQDFLLAILDPNAVIEPRFIQYNIETTDGRSLSGVISEETATSVTLSQAGGTKEKILRTEIDQMKPSSLSLMPEGLEQGRNAQDFADLLAYIKTRPATFGSATPEQAAAARKKFLESSATSVHVTAASEKTDYTSWLGTIPFSHCRATDGKSKLTWQTPSMPAQVNPDQFYDFRFPAGMGFYSQAPAKFHLKVNGKDAFGFDVSLDDRSWASKDGRISMRYQVMETSPEDSNGVLTFSLKGDLLEANKPVVFEVTGAAGNSQRWFGIYVLKELALH